MPEAPQSLASSGSTSTLRTLSLKAQAKNVLHYSLRQKLVAPTKPEKTGQRDSGRDRQKKERKKGGGGEKGREESEETRLPRDWSPLRTNTDMTMVSEV